MKNLIDGLKWRYSVNKFDTNKKLTDEQIAGLVDAAILAPTSFGLQPFKIIVITNPEIRAKLQAAGYGQPKISEASHLVLFAVKKNIDNNLVDEYIKLVSDIRGVPVEGLKAYGDMIKNSAGSMTEEKKIEWAGRQAYIALGVLIAAASLQGIDSAPMEGFDPKKFDEILGLNKLGLQSRVAVAVGFRDPSDPNASYKKVRLPHKEAVVEIK